MHAHATPVLDDLTSAAAATSPVIGGGRWFEPGPFVLRIERPMEFAEMVAALYGAVAVEWDDLAADEDVWGLVAGEVTIRGMIAICADADHIERAEAAGGVDAPDWLAFCRQRVSALLTSSRELAAAGAVR